MDDIGDWFEGAADDVGDWVEGAADDVAKAVVDAAVTTVDLVEHPKKNA